uniref:ALMS motif domain-containing protein n=1 Tax=Plectus sambesii TaxID=2011161 RepID=A0A914URW0_9BILA
MAGIDDSRSPPAGLENEDDRLRPFQRQQQSNQHDDVAMQMQLLLNLGDNVLSAAPEGLREEPEGQGSRLPPQQPIGRVVTGGDGGGANGTASSVANASAAAQPQDLLSYTQADDELSSLSDEGKQQFKSVSEPHLSSSQEGILSIRDLPHSTRPSSNPEQPFFGLASLYKPMSERAGRAAMTTTTTHTDNIGESSRAAMEAPLQTSTPVMYESSAESSSATTNASISAARMIHMTTLPDGRIDYDRLKQLLREERREFRTKLDREKAKRVALEELLVKYGQKKRAERRHKRASRNDSEQQVHEVTRPTTSSTTSTSTVDSSDLILELVRRQLKKGKKQRNERSSHLSGSGYSTLQETSSGVETPTPTREQQADEIVRGDRPPLKTKENFYQSTSLFSYPLHDANTARVHAEDRVATSENGDLVATLRASQPAFGQPPSAPPPVPPIPSHPLVSSPRRSGGSLRKAFPSRTVQPTVTKPPTGWWWVSHEGLSTERMPPLVKDSLRSKRPDFLARCAARQRRIDEASKERENVQRIIRQVAQDVAVGVKTVDQANAILQRHRSDHISAFPRRQMILDTQRRFRKLPEYVAKKNERSRQLEMATNRAVAQMFKQRLVYQVLSKRSSAI